jgi:hypothetical protein
MRILNLVAGLGLAMWTSCAAEPDNPITSEVSDEVVSATTYAGDCTPDMRAVLDKSRRYERAIVGSRAFEQCVDQGVRNGVAIWTGAAVGPYHADSGDPFETSSVDWQVRQALSIARATNDVHMTCTGGGPAANAWAAIGWYENTQPEAMQWSGWLAGVVAGPKTDTIPWAQIAGSISHTAMQWHGYGPLQSMPGIVGGCIEGVLERSHDACGNADVCGGGASIKLLDGYGGTTCSCTTDAGQASTRLANAFTHVTTTANTPAWGGYTELDDARLNWQPGAIVQFLHVYQPAGTPGAYLGRGAYASYDAYSGRWRIYPARGTMPVGTGFFVRVGRGFVHEATAANALNPFISRFDNIFSNTNGSAMLQVSPLSTGTPNPHPIGTFFDATTNRWTVFNQDLAPIPAGAKFAISIENERNRGLHYAHAVTTANRNAYGATMLTSALLDGNPNARFLATPNGKRGPVWNAEEYGAWYDGYHWWLYSERDGAASANLTLGTVFDIEVLRDELHRVVRVAEASYGADTGIDVQPRDLIHIQAVQRLQAHYEYSSVNPLGEPVVHSQYALVTSLPWGSLLGWLSGEGYFPVGEEKWRMGPAAYQRLYLIANDSVPFDGAGYFSAEVTVFR